MPSRGENTPERGREDGRSRKCLQLSLKKGLGGKNWKNLNHFDTQARVEGFL